MKSFSRLPSICQRCMSEVPRYARTCPHCAEPLQRISIARVMYILAGALLVLGLLGSTAVMLYRLFQYSAE